jgi:hypothetical protein
MTSASGTHTLLHNGRFDGISDSINWSVSRTYRAPAPAPIRDDETTIFLSMEASDGGVVYQVEWTVYTKVDSDTMKEFLMFLHVT